MKDPRNKNRKSTGFLFCQRCGLRRPKNGNSKYCPNCGSKMIEEGPLPYITKSSSKNKNVNKKRTMEGSAMDMNDSIYRLMQQKQLDKKTAVLSRVSAVEIADSGNYEKAINELTKAIRTDPNDTGSYFARATLKVRIGDIEGARKDFIMCENCRHENKIDLEEYPLL